MSGESGDDPSRTQDSDEVGFPFSEVEVSDETWSIIERANRDGEKLRELLWELSEQDLRRFYKEYEEAVGWIRSSPFDRLINEAEDMPLSGIGPISEDGMEDLAHWVVSHGREVYKKVFENPVEILPYARAEDHPEILTVAIDVIIRKYGRDGFDQSLSRTSLSQAPQTLDSRRDPSQPLSDPLDQRHGGGAARE